MVLGTLQDLERAVLEMSGAYRQELQQDISAALRGQNEDYPITISPLVHHVGRDSLADYFFTMRAPFTASTPGYIFPFRRKAVVDQSPFVKAFAQVLIPQGYEVFRYGSHRGIPDVGTLIHFLDKDKSSRLQPVAPVYA